MDKKIIAIILVAVVVIAAVAVFFITKDNGNSDDPDTPVKTSDYVSLGLTNNYFPDHTCCVIAANYNFAQNNNQDMQRFLAAYYDAVKYVQDSLADTSSQAYKDLIEFSKTKVANVTEAEIKAALANIDYLYADTKDGSLNALKSDVKELVSGLKGVGALTKEISDANAFANNFVNDSYLKDAIANKDSLGSGNAKITVSVISGDIHQIGIHVAEWKGYFTSYGLDVTFSPASNGAGVATAVINGDANIGLLGAPPATINMINMGYITSDSVVDASKAYNLVARVNSEGSGLFINNNVLDDSNSTIPERNGTPFYSVSGDKYVVSEANAKAWGGLIFGTPGTTSIQHIQFLTLVNDLGLKAEQYVVGTKLSNDKVYFVTNLADFSKITADPSINGGIIWEPQYQRVIQEA